MTTIPGASQYLNASTYANKTGSSVQGSSLADSMSTSLLSVGRRLSTSGFGLSDSARALNESFLSQSSASINGLFSATVGETSSIENLQLQILALRAGKSDNQLGPDLVTFEDDGAPAASSNGTVVDQEV